jgi:FkbM family methyltransferase
MRSTSWRRALADTAERWLGLRIVRPGQLPLLFEQEHLRRFLAHFAVDCVFDVGANGGQYAAMLRERVGYGGFIVSYEPVPELAQRMRELARSDPRWFIEEAALDRTVGTARFNVMADAQFSSFHETSSAAADLFATPAAVMRKLEVRTATVAHELVRYRERLGFRRPFLKMDTQGHDLAVAEGAGPALRDFVGLQSELAIQRIYADSPAHDEALRFYRERGFEPSAFVPNNAGHFPRLIEIDCILYRRTE